MIHTNLALRVKELRKQKGLSQDSLSKKSGLSLRTIQRIENSTTTASGETIRRISLVLEVKPIALINSNTVKEASFDCIKIKTGYLHVLKNQLIISSTNKLDTIVEDYSDSVNNVFKSLFVFLIGIPLFAVISSISFNTNHTEIAMFAGAFSFLFLILSIYLMLFTSGSSCIKKIDIIKIKISRNSISTSLIIYHKESGRLKKRNIFIEKNQIPIITNTLIKNNLLTHEDLYATRNFMLYFTSLLFCILSITPLLLKLFLDITPMLTSASLILLLSLILLIKIVIGLCKPLSTKLANSLHF